MQLDHGAVAYGPFHASMAVQFSDDVSYWLDRLLAIVDSERYSRRAHLMTRGRLEWEHNFCEDPAYRMPLKPGGSGTRDFVFEVMLRGRRPGAVAPADLCAGCFHSFYVPTEPDKALLAAFASSKRSRIPDQETRRRDVAAHTFHPATPHAPKPKPRKGGRRS
jgi:hypothetical protein